MEINSTYSVKIKQYNHILEKTVEFYRSTVDFYIDVILKEWDRFRELRHAKFAVACAEKISISTKSHPVVPYHFDALLYHNNRRIPHPQHKQGGDECGRLPQKMSKKHKKVQNPLSGGVTRVFTCFLKG